MNYFFQHLGKMVRTRSIQLLLPVSICSLLAASIYFAITIDRAFPDSVPLPDPAVRKKEQPAPESRLKVIYDFIERLPEARLEIPNLEKGYEAAVDSFRHMIPLRQGVDMPGGGEMAVGLPLGVIPGSMEEVDHELRHALYLPTPAAVSWRLTLPPVAHLKLAPVLLPDEKEGSATLKVTIRTPGKQSPIRTIELPLSPPRTGQKEAPATGHGWHEKVFDLSAFSGTEVEITFSSSCTASIGSPSSPPVQVLVGSPALLSPVEMNRQQSPNLLWINIDTVQARSTGIGGDQHRTTPELDRTAAEGVTFSRAYAASNWTRTSNMSFMTGLHPSETGMKTSMIPTLPEERNSYYLSNITALPRHLSNLGYRTRAIVQNNLLEDLWGTGVDIGFKEYRYVEDTLDHSSKITTDAIEFIDRHQNEAWFLYLGYNAPHWPYRPTKEALAQVGMAEDSPAEWLSSLYRGEVSLSDRYIAPLIQSLRNLKLDKDTLVIINSDHGEQLSRQHAQEIIRASVWERGKSVHVITRPGHETLYEETVHVPLVMWWPGTIPAGSVVDIPMGMVDIPPTILDLMGLPPLDKNRGRSLAPALRGKTLQSRPLLIEGKSIYGVIDWPLKYIRREPKNGREWVRSIIRESTLKRIPEELYNLEQDPEELMNLSASLPDELARMRSLLTALLPRNRYIYYIEIRGPEDEAAPPLNTLVRFSPAEHIESLHMLSTEQSDVTAAGPESLNASLVSGGGDSDLLAVVLKETGAPVTVDFQEIVSSSTGAGRPSSQPVPIRLGSFHLKTEETRLLFDDQMSPSLLDSTHAPTLPPESIGVWRLPVTGGIKGRGEPLDETVRNTFQNWGYAQ